MQRQKLVLSECNLLYAEILFLATMISAFSKLNIIMHPLNRKLKLPSHFDESLRRKGLHAILSGRATQPTT